MRSLDHLTSAGAGAGATHGAALAPRASPGSRHCPRYRSRNKYSNRMYLSFLFKL